MQPSIISHKPNIKFYEQIKWCWVAGACNIFGCIKCLHSIETLVNTKKQVIQGGWGETQEAHSLKGPGKIFIVPAAFLGVSNGNI